MEAIIEHHSVDLCHNLFINVQNRSTRGFIMLRQMSHYGHSQWKEDLPRPSNWKRWCTAHLYISTHLNWKEGKDYMISQAKFRRAATTLLICHDSRLSWEETQKMTNCGNGFTFFNRYPIDVYREYYENIALFRRGWSSTKTLIGICTQTSR